MNGWPKIWSLVLLSLMAGASPVFSQYDFELEEEDMEEMDLSGLEEPLEWTVSAGYSDIRFYHNALQTRSDDDVASSEDWRDGNSEGDGWGLDLAVGRKTTRIRGRILDDSTEYTLQKPGLFHSIASDRQDFNLTWEEQTGEGERGVWGWLVGVRYLTQDHRLFLQEGEDILTQDGDIDWVLGQAGYWGDVQPFFREWLSFYGSTRIFLGEADGVARKDSDRGIDGRIDQSYENQFSVAYGWNFEVGMDVHVMDRVTLSLEYYREWLYSFDSTDSGVIIFPDNNDALFIDSSHGLKLFARARF